MSSMMVRRRKRVRIDAAASYLECQKLEQAVLKVFRHCSNRVHDPSNAVDVASFQVCRNEYHLTIGKFSWSRNERFFLSRIMVATNDYVNDVPETLVCLWGDNVLEKVSKEWWSFKTALKIIYEPLKFVQMRSPPLRSLMEQGVSLWMRMMRNGRLKSKLVSEVSILLQFNRGGPVHKRFIQEKALYIEMLKGLSPNAYREFFEDIYIKQATLFYSWCSKNARATGLSSYLRTVEIRLNKDIARASKFLPDTETVEKLSIVLHSEMIHKQLRYILGGLDWILREMVSPCLTQDVPSTCSGDLQRMCRLFRNVPFWIQSMCNAIDRIDLHEIARDLFQDEGLSFLWRISRLHEKLVNLKRELEGEPRVQKAVVSAQIRLNQEFKRLWHPHGFA